MLIAANGDHVREVKGLRFAGALDEERNLNL
jgi:hypothetical protein